MKVLKHDKIIVRNETLNFKLPVYNKKMKNMPNDCHY